MRRSRREPSLSQIAEEIRTLAKTDAISFTDHALEEMTKDRFTVDDVKYALKACTIVEQQGNAKYCCRGRTIDGRSMSVIARLRIILKNWGNALVIMVWKLVPRSWTPKSPG